MQCSHEVATIVLLGDLDGLSLLSTAERRKEAQRDSSNDVKIDGQLFKAIKEKTRVP